MLVKMKKEKAIEKSAWLLALCQNYHPHFCRKFNQRQLPMFFCAIFFESEVVGFHCSPYSATILLSKPHQGKLTIKADLIFEEYSTASAIICLTSFAFVYTGIGFQTKSSFCIIVHVVGIDIRQKLLLMKENNLSMNYKKRNKQPSSSPLPEEVYIIDDDEPTSQAPAKEHNRSVNSERKNDSL